MPRHILAAVDLETQSQAVLSRAIEIAAVTSCALTVLHVIEVGQNDVSGGEEPLGSNAAYQYLIKRGQEAIERLVSECINTKTQIHIDIVVKTDQSTGDILSVAETICAPLIVIGISNRRSLQERLIGSTADRVIRASRASVLVIKRPVAAPYRRVIAAIDFSPDAEAAVSAPSVLLPHARLKVVHVTDIPVQFQQALLLTGTSEEEITRYRRARLEHARERLRQFAKRLLAHGSYKSEVLEGEPARTLVRLSRSRAVDVIAIGPHGRGAILQLFLGSVAQKLLREAACDLLIARAPRETHREA